MKEVIGKNLRLILLVLLAFLLMAGVSYVHVGRVIRNRVDLYSGKEMALYGASLESLVRANEDALLHAATTVALALDGSAPPQELASVLAALGRTYSAQPGIEGVFLSVYGFLDGDFIDGSGVVPGAFFNPKSAAWLQGALAAGGLHSTGPYIDSRTGQSVVAVSRPVQDGQGRIRGALAVDFRLEPIVERVAQLKLGGAGFGFLLGGDLVVLAHPDPTLTGLRLSEVPDLAPLAGVFEALDPGGLAVERVRVGGVASVAFLARLDNGWFLGSVSPLSWHYGEVRGLIPSLGVIGLILAFVLSVVLVRLSMAKSQSEEESRSKSSFLARVSHEIRTPMNAIIGFSELAHRDYGRAEALGHIVEIRRAGLILLRLINDILDYSRLESGKYRVVDSAYRPARLIEEVLAIVRLRAVEKSLRLETRIAPDLPGELLGDDRGVRQVLVNLLNNAIKYTERGHVRLSASKEAVNDQEIKLVLVVEDSGAGISEADQGRLFSDFERLQGGVERQVEGSGLGLVISRGIARLMGGDITVESVPGRGSSFTATFRQVVLDPEPGDRDRELGRSAETMVHQSPASFTAPGRRVLVVDDTATNLTVAQGLLAPYGLEVVTCLSGSEAVGLERERHFDLILIDQMMPGLDGVETLKALRALGPSRRATPMVALTANAMAGARESLISQGFDDFLSKPVDSAELDLILAKWIQPVARLADNPAETASREGGDMLLLASALGRAGIDARTGLDRCGGSPDVYKKLLNAFLIDAERLEPALEPAGPVGDLIIRVHALKSAATNIGALGLSAEAAGLEAELKSGSLSAGWEGRLGGLRRELAAMAAAVREATSRNGSGQIQRPAPGAPGASGDELIRLKEALESGDVGLADRLVESLAASGDESLREALERVSLLVLLSDYKEAARLVGSLGRAPKAGDRGA